MEELLSLCDNSYRIIICNSYVVNNKVVGGDAGKKVKNCSMGGPCFHGP